MSTVATPAATDQGVKGRGDVTVIGTDPSTGWDVVTAFSGHGTVVVPRRSTRGQLSLLFVQPNRHAIENVATLEFPRGGADQGESSAVAAAREMVEETGIWTEPQRLRKVGTIHPDTGILSNTVDVYVSTVQEGAQEDPEDGVELVWLSYGEVLGAITAGKITCGITLASLALLTTAGLDRMPWRDRAGAAHVVNAGGSSPPSYRDCPPAHAP